MIEDNTAEINKLVNDQETMQNNKLCRYRRPTS